MEGTDITEPIVKLSQNQATCICLRRCATLSQKYGDFSSLHLTESWRWGWLRCAIMSREKCGQASSQRPCRRTQHSDHRCDDELERPQIVRGWISRDISSNPCEYRSGHGSTHRNNNRQDAGFTNCTGGSG